MAGRRKASIDSMEEGASLSMSCLGHPGFFPRLTPGLTHQESLRGGRLLADKKSLLLALELLQKASHALFVSCVTRNSK